jgi:hypothetical protein
VDPFAEGPPELRALEDGRRILVCPACGFEEDLSARFCSFCAHNFQRTQELDQIELAQRQAIASGNPLTDDSPSAAQAFIERFRELPPNIRIAGVAGIVILLLLILFGR